MKTMVLQIAILAGVLAPFQSRCETPGDMHRQLMRDKFDSTWYKNFYPDDRWRIRCIFVDMDGDGIDEVVTLSTSEEDPMVPVWRFWRESGDGNLKQIRRNIDDISFWSSHESFYKVAFRNAAARVIGLGMTAGRMDAERRRIVDPTPDCWLTISSDGRCEARQIRPDFETLFRGKDVAAVERLYPEWYFGYDFRPPPDDPVNYPYLRRLPYRPPRGDLRPGGGVGEPEGFRAFAAEYRKSAGGATVLAVFLDADNDGDADCYVSSDAEAADGGAFRWTLFMNEGGRLSAAKGAVHPVKSRPELCALPPSVTVAPDGFCRVVRYDVDPFFIILDDNAKPNAVREATGCYSFHRIEKLPCREFSTQTQR